MEWIRLDEILPEYGDPVLFYRPGMGRFLGCRIKTNEGDYWSDDMYDFKAELVSHWMPLPEPPRVD